MDEGTRNFGMKLIGNMIILGISGLALILTATAAIVLTIPDVGQLENCFTASMFKVYLCPRSETYVRLQNISPYVIHAVIAAEDGSFYSHKGFDWHELKASFQTNLRNGGFRRGGSTLTQQLAKNAFLTQDKSLWRKLKEAYLANAIEHRYKKDFILEKYLNVVEFGPSLYGVKAAASHYFHKSPAALHPLEAAFLAFLLPNPKEYSKSYRDGHLTKFARKMVTIILKRMVAFGKLTPGAYQTAMTSLDSFPWTGLSMGSFEGRPTYSLEATSTPDANDTDLHIDENLLNEMLRENDDFISPESQTAPPAEGGSDMDNADASEPDFE
jgi:monofunctional biosynthetic peptidoglycan transglycosylase